MSLFRSAEDAEPVRPGVGGTHQQRRRADAEHLAVATLACPSCDAPVDPGPRALTPAAPLSCPVCDHAAAVRDFLSLAAASRPARVNVVVRINRPLAPRRRAGPRIDPPT